MWVYSSIQVRKDFSDLEKNRKVHSRLGKNIPDLEEEYSWLRKADSRVSEKNIPDLDKNIPDLETNISEEQN
jgi:hypothetical protein